MQGYNAATKRDTSARQMNGLMSHSLKREQKHFDEMSQYYLRIIAESRKEMNRLIKVLLNLSHVDKTEKIKEKEEMNAFVHEVRKDSRMETSYRSTT